MNGIKLNPIVMDSRFFEGLRLLLEILLMILNFFDDDGKIDDEKKDLLFSRIHEELNKDPKLIELVRSAVGLTESAAACKPVKESGVIHPFNPPTKVG